MKITKKKLENIIREEIQNVLSEGPLDKYKAGFKALTRGENPLKAAAAKEIENMPIYRSKKGPKNVKAKQGIKQTLTILQKIKKITQSGKQSERQMQREMEKLSMKPYGPLNMTYNLRDDLIDSGMIPKVRIPGFKQPRVDQKHPLYLAYQKLLPVAMQVFKMGADGKPANPLQMSSEILQGDVSQIEALEQALKTFESEVLKYK